MTNPNDLIPRKEVEKLLDKKSKQIRETEWYKNRISEHICIAWVYEELKEKISQIESVNPIVIWFDPAKPWAERTYPLSAIGIDVSK